VQLVFLVASPCAGQGVLLRCTACMSGMETPSLKMPTPSPHVQVLDGSRMCAKGRWYASQSRHHTLASFLCRQRELAAGYAAYGDDAGWPKCSYMMRAAPALHRSGATAHPRCRVWRGEFTPFPAVARLVRRNDGLAWFLNKRKQRCSARNSGHEFCHKDAKLFREEIARS
jgi:hypothetical protein